MKVLPIKVIDEMDFTEKKAYFESSREYCSRTKENPRSKAFFKRMFAKLALHLRNYDFEVILPEYEFPKDKGLVFVCNHSNSHDFFTVMEAFNRIGRHVTPFGAVDCLDGGTKILFSLGDVTLIDRRDKASSQDGLFRFASKIISGKDGIIFAESTWNLHPVRPMQNIKAGGVLAALIADTVVVPTIFEYIETDGVVSREKELYKKVIVHFGEPIEVSCREGIISQTNHICQIMTEMRQRIWAKHGIKKNSMNDINPEVYLNHTYLKKYDALGFQYDSAYEQQFLLKEGDRLCENEYTLDEAGRFVPGVTSKTR